METVDFESFVKRVKSKVIDSLPGIDRPISDSDMVLKFLDHFLPSILPNTYSPLKEKISSMCPLSTFEEACYMLYKYKPENKKDPVRPITTYPHGIHVAEKTFSTLGDVVDLVGKLGDAVDEAGKLGVPIGAAVSSVASTAGAFGHLGLAIKAGYLLTLGGWKIYQGLSRK